MRHEPRALARLRRMGAGPAPRTGVAGVRPSSRGPTGLAAPFPHDLCSEAARGAAVTARRSRVELTISAGWCSCWRPPRCWNGGPARTTDPAQVAVLMRRAHQRREEADALRERLAARGAALTQQQATAMSPQRPRLLRAPSPGIRPGSP